MNPIRINLEQLKNKTIPIGREGENEYTVVRIDCGKVFAEHPQAEVSMKVKPPKGITYPVTVQREGNEIVWTVHDYDLASKGDGQFQLTFTDGTVICKTAIGRTLVLKSLEGNGPAPTPIDDWMKEAQEALDAVQDAEVNQPVIGEDGYWYTWNQEAGEYQKTDTKAEGQDGEDGHTPVLTSSKSGKTTTIYADGDQLAQIQDGQDANIDDTSTAADKVWSAAKSNTLLSAMQDIPNAKIGRDEADFILCDEAGNALLVLENGGIKTKHFDSEKAAQGSNELQNDSDLDFTDEDGNVILRVYDGQIKAKKFDSANVDWKNNIMARNRDTVDGVYAACRWHQPTSTSKEFCLLISGDIHGDSDRMKSMVQYFNAVGAFDAGIMLGDIASSNWSDDATFYTQAIQNVNKPWLTVIGNHDAGGIYQGQSQTDTGYTNISDLCAKFITPNIDKADLASGEYVDGNTYYYKDFANQKIRIIVLNQYEYPADISGGEFVYRRGYVCYSQNQIDWLCNTLLSVPSDYGVIIALHSYPAWMAIDHDNPLTSSTANTTNTDYLIEYSNGFIIEDIVNAWINGNLISKSYNYVPSGSYGDDIDVSADFSSRGSGEFITYIGGHWHMSQFSTTHADEQPLFNVPSAGVSTSRQGDTPRVIGTRSEDNFCALAVDRTNKVVKIFQIGAHFTKDGKDRQYGTYEY